MDLPELQRGPMVRHVRVQCAPVRPQGTYSEQHPQIVGEPQPIATHTCTHPQPRPHMRLHMLHIFCSHPPRMCMKMPTPSSSTCGDLLKWLRVSFHGRSIFLTLRYQVPVGFVNALVLLPQSTQVVPFRTFLGQVSLLFGFCPL